MEYRFDPAEAGLPFEDDQHMAAKQIASSVNPISVLNVRELLADWVVIHDTSIEA